MVTHRTTGLPPLLPAHLTRPDPAGLPAPRPTTGTRTPTAPTDTNLLRARAVDIAIPRPPPPPPPPARRTGWWGRVVRVLRWLRLYKRGAYGGDCALQWWRGLHRREVAARGPLRMACWRILQGGG
ncbi:uncharacterized protein H6S33_006678 [Morchella sextelata]|uniref:uncharacterized protein n=1 Tax=Morchella sextelata TaxID=1174677 RepID=UPI001D056DC1|nr:uncharacterized protein H6S33_006678 [Morchella sextelata]KAH0604301.1 hypothetical protein H6S33_006678 [Morchella sextelata]